MIYESYFDIVCKECRKGLDGCTDPNDDGKILIEPCVCCAEKQSEKEYKMSKHQIISIMAASIYSSDRLANTTNERMRIAIDHAEMLYKKAIRQFEKEGSE